MPIVQGWLDYISGHLRYGHFELDLTDEELEDFKNLSKKEQIATLKKEGELVIDDTYISDYGDIHDITIN